MRLHAKDDRVWALIGLAVALFHIHVCVIADKNGVIQRMNRTTGTQAYMGLSLCISKVPAAVPRTRDYVY